MRVTLPPTVPFSRIKVDLLDPAGARTLQRDGHLDLGEFGWVFQVVEQELSGALDQATDRDRVIVNVVDGRNTSMVTDKMDVVRGDVRFEEIGLMRANCTSKLPDYATAI